MKTIFVTNQLRLAAACALALGFISGAAQAQSFPPASERALVSNTGGQVWKNGFGECWHNAFGPPPAPGAECDPNYRVPVAAVIPAPAPVIVAAAPPPPSPAPVVVAQAAPAPAPQRVIQKVTFDADALFDFDKAVLRPEGRTALDTLVSSLNGVDLESIMATGHTDRFGTLRYNQTLSESRADAVKTYLVEKGIQSNRVQSAGKGETQPVTKTGECRGAKSVKVVACLQPDCRVDIDVIGTKTTLVSR